MHCILLLWESQEWRLEPNILTWCYAAYRRSPFPQSLPRFHPSDRAAAPIGKNIHTFTVPFLRRGFSPRFSVLAQIPREPCSCMPIFICKLIMNLFVHFVNIFTQKNSKNSKNGSVPHRAHFEHAFSASVLTVLGQNATFEHRMSAMLNPCSK